MQSFRGAGEALHRRMLQTTETLSSRKFKNGILFLLHHSGEETQALHLVYNLTHLKRIRNVEENHVIGINGMGKIV